MLVKVDVWTTDTLNTGHSMSSQHNERLEELRERFGEAETQDRGRVRELLSSARPRNMMDGVASLINADDTNPEVRAHTSSSTEVYSGAVDIDRPRKETEYYWKEYKRNPIISTQINSLDYEVFEAGYWVEADSEETQEELSEFLTNIGVNSGQVHRPFREVGSQALTQYMVRGTYLGEQVMEEIDGEKRHVGVSPISVTTVEMYTKEGSPVLASPDYKNDQADEQFVKKTPDGKTAAYVQFDDTDTRWGDRKERRFARDQVLHWARKPDVGEARGTSVIESVFNRSMAYREKLQDNDLAISMKAWPMILFQMGSPEHPWTEEEQRTFLETYSEGELGPATFQGVPGDIDIHEFAGETADIREHVNTDVDHIIAGMPGPRYSIGSFAMDSSDALTSAHERQYRKLIRQLRRDLENVFTPYLKDVAESWGYDPSGVELNIGRPEKEVAPEDIQGSVIRYQSDVGSDDDTAPQERSAPDTGDDDEQPDGNYLGGPDGETQQSQSQQQTAEPAQNRSDTIAELAGDLPDHDVVELADPRLVSINSYEKQSSDEVSDVFVSVRDDVISEVVDRGGTQSMPSPMAVEAEFEAEMGTAVRSESLGKTLGDICYEVVSDTRDTLQQHTHYPNISSHAHTSHTSLVRSTKNQMIADIVDLGQHIASDMRRHADRSEDPDAFAERVESEYTEAMLSERVAIIVRMNLKQLINKIKLHSYKRTDGVYGVSITAPCSDDTHELTASIAGCGDSEQAVAEFDNNDSIGSQFQDQVTVEPPVGFDPLPELPPYHFGDVSELEPIYE